MITLAPPPAPGLIAVGADRWRVVDRDGVVRGLIATTVTPSGLRFRALRFHVASRAFHPVGDFWSAAEAAETLRLSR